LNLLVGGTGGSLMALWMEWAITILAVGVVSLLLFVWFKRA
jgi:hypothetical protein